MNLKITISDLISQIERIPSDWRNGLSDEVVRSIEKICKYFEENGINEKSLEHILNTEKYALDVVRLMLELSQDEFLNELLYFAKIPIGRSFASARNNSKKFSKKIAKILIHRLNIDKLESDFHKNWNYCEILTERYKYTRGRAIKGQKRGRVLEDEVEELLKEIEIPYTRGGDFFTSKGKAKADFSIPSNDNPRIVIEVKGYEATGSKLTDVLGDILKILQIKDEDQKFFFVTDGIGWFRRISDLEHIVDLCNKGDIEMIYTRKTLNELKKSLKSLINELKYNKK